MANRYKCKYSENLSDELWCKKACSYCTGYQYDNCIERLKSENAELKAMLEKTVELPCKVGDKVYTTKCGYIREVKVRTLFIGNPSYNRGETSQSIEMVRTTEFDIPFENFGKTVFLAKEAAEQALKGGADDE